MGRITLENVSRALEDAGFSTNWGMPAERMFTVTETLAAVSLGSMDVRTGKVSVLVTVLTPAEMGAHECEEMALRVGVVLKGAGGSCTVGKCRLDSSNGLFYTEVTAKFSSKLPEIWIDETEMIHTVRFSSWREWDAETDSWEGVSWAFELEEFFPAGESEEHTSAGTFLLMHTTDDGSESYVNCKWMYQKRENDGSGIRQVRRGVAERMENG